MGNGAIRFEKAGDKFQIYRADSPMSIGVGLVDSLDWPETIPSLLFSFDAYGAEDCRHLTEVLGKKYLGRFLYGAAPADLAALPGSGARGITEYAFRDLKELQDLYLRTETEFFGKKWREYFPGTSYSDAIEFNARERLSSARIFCAGREGTPVSLLPLTRIKHFIDGEDMDWVLWAWVDEGLEPAARREVHSMLSGWLKRKVERRVMTGVHIFNVRSDRFFSKLGFRKQWLQITRIKK